MSRILIAGYGDIGSALGARLLAEGHEVWGLRRSAAPLPGGARPLRMDLTDASSLVELPTGLDAAFYIVTPDAYEDRAYESAFVLGTRNLLHALSSGEHRVRRFIFVSSTSVYAQCEGEWVDESSPTEPVTFSGKRLLEGERCVLEGPIPGVVVRFGGIYGRGEGRLIERVREGKPCQETPPLYTNRIHREDCVGVLHHLLVLEAPRRIYLGVDSDPARQCAVMDWLSAAMGLAPPPRIARGADGGARRGGNKRCRNARLLASGYRLVYPTYREGYGAVLESGGRV